MVLYFYFLLTHKNIIDIILPMVITVGNIDGDDKMKNSKSNVSKEIIIETTLKLIDENGGIKNVTLRDIAKNIGCAHTNLYNYYSSLDEIFWEALGEALIKELEYKPSQLSKEQNRHNNIYTIFENIVDFSMEHPGWYRLIWLETIGGSPSEAVVEIMHKPNGIFISEIIKASNNELDFKKAKAIGNVLHGYLHGELCKWINNRSFLTDAEEVKKGILSNAKLLYKLLIEKEEEI